MSVTLPRLLEHLQLMLLLLLKSVSLGWAGVGGGAPETLLQLSEAAAVTEKKDVFSLCLPVSCQGLQLAELNWKAADRSVLEM